MIKLTRLAGEPFLLNAELIRYVENRPDTFVTLTTGERLAVRESMEEVMRRAIEYQRSKHLFPPAMTGGAAPQDLPTMDIATVGGIVGGFVLMLFALLLAGGHGSGLSLVQFIDPPAAIMVLGGGLCVVLTSVPMRVFLTIPKLLKKLAFNRGEDLAALVEELVSLAEVARRDGLLALEARLPEIANPSIVLGIQMAVDGTRPEVLEDVFRNEIGAEEARHHVGKKMFDLMGRCGPAFGMIATLMGLILMLGNLDDPDSIGPTMAMALVGTLYGAAMANMICAPCGEKLAYLSQQEILGKEIILKGILAIQAGENPRVIEQKLNTYLPPSQRAGAAERAA